MNHKYANVQFHGSAIRYCFWTNILDLKKDDLVLVETVNGFKTALFTGYATAIENQRKANKWILGRIDAERIKSNLMIELEEEGIPISPSVNKKSSERKRFLSTKEMVESETAKILNPKYSIRGNFTWM